MNIGGYLPCSLCDFPGQVAAVVFTQGCNFRCPFCHNAGLLPDAAPVSRLISAQEVRGRLERCQGRIDAVVVTGGEPTVQPDLVEFLKFLRSNGWLVKLDTNGSRPEVISRLLDEKLVDYFAMDLKAPWEKYERLAGASVDVRRLGESVRLIANSGVAHEFRTTLVPGLLTEDDLGSIRSQAPPGSPHHIQPFRPEHALDARLRRTSAQSAFAGRVTSRRRSSNESAAAYQAMS